MKDLVSKLNTRNKRQKINESKWINIGMTQMTTRKRGAIKK